MVHVNATIEKQTGPELVYSVAESIGNGDKMVEEKFPIAQRDGL